MAARNPDASANSNPDGFHASKPRDEPMTTHGHQPGTMVGNDAAPEFTAQTLPAGSAPADRTFKPNNISETTNEVDNQKNADPEASRASASDTLGGATSADVHTGLGHPGQGQSSHELRHDEGQAGGVEARGGTAQGKTVDGRLPENAKTQRAIDTNNPTGERGNTGGAAAQDRVPETAETVAHEAPAS